MHRQINSLIFIVFLTTAIMAQIDLFEKHTFNDESNNAMPYRLLKPDNFQSDKSYPLILFLHGAGDVGDDNESQLSNFPLNFINSSNRSSYPCYIIAPQCPSNDSWTSFPGYPNSVRTPSNPTLPIAMVLSLIDSLRNSENINIDDNKIYVIGFSLGGEGAFDIVTRAPDLFAAAIPICGIADTSKAHLMLNTAFWIFHGRLDEISNVNYSRMIVASLTNLGKPPKYTEYEELDHYCWYEAYEEPDVLSWLFSQSKNPNQVRDKVHDRQINKSSDLSIKRMGHTLLITWLNGINPSCIDIFSINGKLMYKFPVKRSDLTSATLSLPKHGKNTFIVRIKNNNSHIFTRFTDH